MHAKNVKEKYKINWALVAMFKSVIEQELKNRLCLTDAAFEAAKSIKIDIPNVEWEIAIAQIYQRPKV